MQLRPGTRVAHYEIGALLGEGGMGEVYRARDLTLNRDVALKVIGGAGLADPSALPRFEREAHLLASLNHPHIGTIFGVADGGGVRAIVMELVEGETLADRLAGGALPVRDALAVADQIADALEAAHEKGIVHRDLKPANVKFTAGGAVKLLDFGIARTVAAAAPLDSTLEATRAGTILGTAAYMSPEQARGLAVDARSDVWAFGAVLYEMLSGRRAFDGATGSDVVAAIMTRDPDWSALPVDVPPAIVRLLRRCLERDPARRLRQMGAARYAIDEAEAPSAAPVTARTHRATIVGAVLMIAIFISQLVILVRGEKTPRASASIFSMSEPPGEPLYLFAGPIALSPDGTRVALVTNSAEGKPHVWLRALASRTPELLRGAEGGMNPFWSPDGRSLGFFADGQVKIADLASGAIRTLAPWGGPIGGGAWTTSGVIVYSEGGGLRRVAASGGPVTPITTVDGASSTFHAAPCALPDGRHVLYYAVSPKDNRGSVMIVSIDGGEPRRLMDSQSMAVYAAPGYLLYQRAGEILAQSFDARNLSTSGDPVPLVSDAWAWSTGGMMALAVSDTGVLLFAARRPVLSQLTWFERSGRPANTLGEIGEWVHVELSPDERTLAAERIDPRTGAGAVWTIDLARNVPSRLTPEANWSLAPIWSPDGSAIAYGASRQGASDLYVRAADGNGPEKPFYVSPHLKIATDWTRDGRIIFNMVNGGGTDIMSLPAAAGGQPTPVLSTPANEGGGRMSPNGLWLAYVSNESGRNEVYVRAASGHGRWPISSHGGGQPRWRRDGRELYYVNADGGLTAVPVTDAGGAFNAASPEVLPIKLQPDVTGWRMSYDATSQGRRFIASVPAGGDSTPAILAVPYWPAL